MNNCVCPGLGVASSSLDVGPAAQSAIDTSYRSGGGPAWLQAADGTCRGWVRIAGPSGPRQWRGGARVITPLVIPTALACEMSRAINARNISDVEFVVRNGDWQHILMLNAPWTLPPTRTPIRRAFALALTTPMLRF